MAKTPKQTKASEPDPLESDALERLRSCRRWKEQWTLDFKECYFFAAPHRQRQISSQTLPPKNPTQDAAELQTSLAFLLCQDFVTEVVQTYMPEAQRWCERGPGMMIPNEVWKEVEDKVKDSDEHIFKAMKASNLYAEIQKSFYPDLAIGTTGIWIDRRDPSAAVECLAIPLRELEVNLGPNGEIDDRFAVRYTRNTYVKSLIGDIALPKEIEDTIKAKPSDRTELAFGFWRLWDRKDDEVWQHVVLLKEKLIHKTEIKGEGSCPLIVPRFNPSADWPWGLGPLIQGLPDFRQIDELESMKIENVEMHVAPPITYPDDSFAAVEQGIESRMAYPIRPGSENAVKPIYQPPPPDAAIYQHDEMEHRLRKLFFIDFPEQTGDTPPTLGQWSDEMARAQRRIGTPGLSFWREGPAKIFLRFKYLLERAGVLEPIKVDGQIVALLPYNPTQRAAEQQDIATATQAAQILAQMFPEEWKMSIDGGATMKAFVDKMRVSGLLKFRDPKEVQQFVQQAAQLAGAGQGGGAAPTQQPGAPEMPTPPTAPNGAGSQPTRQ